MSRVPTKRAFAFQRVSFSERKRSENSCGGEASLVRQPLSDRAAAPLRARTSLESGLHPTSDVLVTLPGRLRSADVSP